MGGPWTGGEGPGGGGGCQAGNRGGLPLVPTGTGWFGHLQQQFAAAGRRLPGRRGGGVPGIEGREGGRG